MHRRFLSLSFFLAAALPALAGDTYKIDATHSEIGFKVRHFLSKTPGRFAKFQGTIQIDDKDMAKSSVEVSIDVASISTDNENRDKHLKSPDFFDAEKFPVITFKSTSVKEVAKGQLEVTGDFTMRGVTRKITFPITNLGTQASPMGVRAGFVDGTLRINRKDFGVIWNKVLDNGGTMLSDDVDITLNVEAVKIVPKTESAPAK
ncbi:MAG: YceI family protein [Holophagaceae bacterium]|nr:YceI family protein [Holophagaceae bacterium]